MAQPAGRDLTLLDGLALDAQSTSPAERVSALSAAASHALAEAHSWYLQDKKKKRTASKTLRAVAITLTAAGSLWPLVSAAVTWAVLNPSWGFVLLALAGSCLAFDRFFGLSTGWMRDVATINSIALLNTSFILSLSQTELSTLPESDKLKAQLANLRCTLLALQDLVAGESTLWATQFAGMVAALDQSATQIGARPRIDDAGGPNSGAREPGSAETRT